MGSHSDTLKKRKSHPKNKISVLKKQKGKYDVSTPGTEPDENRALRRCYTHGLHMVKGKSEHEMEDYVATKKREIDDYKLGLYAIFYGHSGHDVTDYLKKHLFDDILNEPDFWTDTESAIRRAYKKTDDDILENVVGSRGGSTAVTAILVNGKKMVVANVGDYRAVICRDGVAEQISLDHEPEKEQDAIESKGGYVSKRPGNVPRVNGQLAISRAFGDGKLKEHITSEPDVMFDTIGMDTDFIILASDGPWKMMLNQEAVDCIRDIEDAQVAAEHLIHEALARKSHDDISCIVIAFE